MIDRQLRRQIIALFVLLLVVDWFLYFRYAGHFFQGDTVFLLNHRATSLTGYLKEFTSLNPSGWYRPLTNELLESILYPFAGLHPIPYRIPVYLVFIATTAAVYLLALKLTERHLGAALAAFFFNIHSVNAYTTYDLGFMPELLYAFFYICAALSFLRYVREGNKAARRLSLAFFAASLLSKEAAVTLPAVLLVLSLAFDSVAPHWGQRFVRGFRAISPHIVILAVYVAVAFGYLHVMSFSLSTLFDRSQTPNPNDYIAVLNGGALKNADMALTWAFNIPRGWSGQWHQLKPGMLTYLKFFRMLFFGLMAALLFIRSQRRAVLLGSAWFWITILPALPLVSHFLPYYLFLPVVGLSLVVGAAFVWLYDMIHRFQHLVAAAVIVVVFGGMVYVTDRIIRGNVRDNNLLGASARLASTTLDELRRFHPTLTDGATLYFADAAQGLAWEHDFGGLLKMAYGKNDISVLYQSQGHSLLPNMRNAFVFEVRNGHLIDTTSLYRSDPANIMKFVDSDLTLEVSPSEVTAGRDKYIVGVHALPNGIVRIAYTVDDGALEIFTVQLDADGNVTFDVSSLTRRGTYRFRAFSISGTHEWIQTDKKITVH